jgi:hypothetical protein
VPIDWDTDDPRDCHHRISNERALSWFEPFRPTRVVLGNPGYRKRVIYVFQGLPGTDLTTESGGAAAGEPATARA